MKAGWRRAGLSIACGLCWTLATAAIDAQTPPADPPPPTPLEEALLEHACGAMHPVGTLETGAYLDCRQTRLLYLRAEFGRDLRRLAATERKTIDTACSDLRATRGEHAYIACLTAQLAALPGHGKTRVEAPAVAVPAPAAPAPGAPPPAAASSSLPIAWIGGAALAVLIAGGAGALFMKKRAPRASGECRQCGARLQVSGDLCQACRHDAAEKLRRASAERADHARAEEDVKRRQTERDSKLQQRARDEDARRREAEAQAANARRQEEDARRRREDDAWRQKQISADEASDDFDPHAVLGVARDAGAAAIEAAYQAARAKFDPDLVADMGVELQDHYQRKLQAAQRAYEILAGRA